ncbi:MAG: UDP-glucose 4-epimerase GalE [Oleibacter sp.]|nr:UDP-glucose 4-epimerase GalE [Thalassolituus sp.]
MEKTILVTGGAGYIGSHTCVELLESGYQVVVIDNLSNSSAEALERVFTISGKKPIFIEGDVRNRALLDKIFVDFPIDAVIHFAGLKAVGESCQMPLAYYDNNINSTLTLCQAMEQAGVKNLVFSSSATVYGDPETLPLTEDMPLSATNPYGRSKLIIEEMLRDLPEADAITQSATPWAVILLRYFNPVGAHKTGLIGEDPKDIPNNLMPFIAQVAVKRREYLSIYGDDYDTIDGTGVRDYIHVVDLAKGHVCAVENLLGSSPITGVDAINLGSGDGVSVLQMVSTFAEINQIPVPYQIAPRRSGDIAACYANACKAKKLLNWQTQLSVTDMVKDTWHWQSKNPMGYTV